MDLYNLKNRVFRFLTERVKQNLKKIEDHWKPILVSENIFQGFSTKAECLFGFSLENKHFC